MRTLVTSVESPAVSKYFRIQDKPSVSTTCALDVVPSLWGAGSGWLIVSGSMVGPMLVEEVEQTMFVLSRKVLLVFLLPGPGESFEYNEEQD